MKLIPITPPNGVFALAAVARAIKTTLQEVAQDARADLEKTTATWEHEVEFTIAPIPEGLLISTTDRIWNMVDRGTRPHIIVPKRGKVLVFGPGKRPKTTVRVIGSGAGGGAGAPVVAHIVHHPGTDARQFSDVVQKQYQDELPCRMQAAIDAAVRR